MGCSQTTYGTLSWETVVEFREDLRIVLIVPMQMSQGQVVVINQKSEGRFVRKGEFTPGS